ncbi:hypothetical protein ACP70R_001546 [Stipagrostis hirtigluma subsp. patula]
MLVAGKAAQTLASYHYGFQAMLIGMRCTASRCASPPPRARRAHDTGAIVSYMQMDAGTVFAATNGLHGLWLMPLQISVALLLLYAYLGATVFLTLTVIAAVTAITSLANKLNLSYNVKFRAVRDRCIKAITEMLSHMHVIKMQAWEETFGGKVCDIRQEELGWLARKMVFVCINDAVFSSGPLATTVLVFAMYLKGSVGRRGIVGVASRGRFLDGGGRSGAGRGAARILFDGEGAHRRKRIACPA